MPLQNAPITSATVVLGSTKIEVLEIQGAPEDVDINRLLGEETWHYGDVDEVTFDMATSLVHGWDNSFATLNVRLDPGPNKKPQTYIEIGSHHDQVVRLHGTPFGVTVDHRRDAETWYFYEGAVNFSWTTGEVTSWENYSGELKVRDGGTIPSEPRPVSSQWERETSNSYDWPTVGRSNPKYGVAERIGGAIGTGLAFLFALWIFLALASAFIAMIWSLLQSLF